MSIILTSLTNKAKNQLYRICPFLRIVRIFWIRIIAILTIYSACNETFPPIKFHIDTIKEKIKTYLRWNPTKRWVPNLGELFSTQPLPLNPWVEKFEFTQPNLVISDQVLLKLKHFERTYLLIKDVRLF
jgi:hypothetical protein